MKAIVSRSQRIYFCISLLVTAGVFMYLMTHVTLHEISELIRHADISFLCAFAMLSLAMSVLRAWRYQVVLTISGFRPSRLSLFLVVLVRNLCSDLLPARLGTLVYVYLATSRLGVGFGASMSSFSLAFLFDLVAIAPMIALAALGLGAGSVLSPSVLLIGAVAVVGVTVAILILLPVLFDRVGRVAFRRQTRASRPHSRWEAAWASARDEILKARSAGVYTRLFVLSLLVRITKYAALYVLLVAMLLPQGYTLGELSLPRVFIGLCSAELAASLPVSGIAGFGAYEGAWMLVFQLLGFPADMAQVTSITHHLVTQLFGYSLGILGLLLLLPGPGRGMIKRVKASGV